MESIIRIKEQLPHGAQKEIAKKLSISQLDVNRVLNGKKTDIKIMQGVIGYFSEYKSKRANYLNKLKRWLNPNSLFPIN